MKIINDLMSMFDDAGVVCLLSFFAGMLVLMGGWGTAAGLIGEFFLLVMAYNNKKGMII